MENKKDNQAQPMKSVSQMIEELMTFEKNIKSIYEKVTDQKTKTIVTSMFQDLSAKVKELGAHLTTTTTVPSEDAAEVPDSDTGEESVAAKPKIKKSKSSQAPQAHVP